MKKRAITVLILFAILIPLILVKQLSFVFDIFMSALAGIAILEMMRAFSKEKQINKYTRFIILLATMMLTQMIGNGFELIQTGSYYNVLFGSVLFLIFVLGLIFVLDQSFESKSLQMSFFSILYISLGAGSMMLMKNINVLLIIFLLLVTMVTDTFAYFIGIAIGKNKMAPSISPKKTWEGAIGGTLVASITVTSIFMFMDKIFFMDFINPNKTSKIIDLIYPSNTLSNFGAWGLMIGLVLLLSVAGQIGDLLASKLKREYDIKDFGTILPGHGGIMDRFDSSFFVGIILLALVVLLGGF